MDDRFELSDGRKVNRKAWLQNSEVQTDAKRYKAWESKSKARAMQTPRATAEDGMKSSRDWRGDWLESRCASRQVTLTEFLKAMKKLVGNRGRMVTLTYEKSLLGQCSKELRIISKDQDLMRQQ